MAKKKKKAKEQKKALKLQRKQHLRRNAAKPVIVKKAKTSGEEGKGISFSHAVPARVEELIGRTGTRGDASQVRCMVLEGRDRDKVLRRNVRGPVQIGDILMLRETEIEARPLHRGKGKKPKKKR